MGPKFAPLQNDRLFQVIQGGLSSRVSSSIYSPVSRENRRPSAHMGDATRYAAVSAIFCSAHDSC